MKKQRKVSKTVRNKGYFAVVDKLDMPYNRHPADDVLRGYPLVFTSISEAISEAAEIEKSGGYAKVVSCVVEVERYKKPNYQLSNGKNN